MHFLTLLLALVLDRVVGDPPALWARLPHPVVWFGKAIALFDRLFNRADLTPLTRRRNGAMTIVVLLLLSLLLGVVLHRLLRHLGPLGLGLEAVIVAVLLAQKSLSDHVGAVARGLKADGLDGGRREVAKIVGRDPNRLDASGVCRAALESLAENFSDGVVAPAFWYAVLGLPGILAYKMLNTADSMIGHLNDRYRDFGWASARLDDHANWPASRLSLLLIAAGALVARGPVAARRALVTGLRDSGMHRSPNAGWPESGLAGALDIQLAGPRVYDGVMVSEPRINGAGRANLSAEDIEAGLKVYAGACSALAVLAALGILILC